MQTLTEQSHAVNDRLHFCDHHQHLFGPPRLLRPDHTVNGLDSSSSGPASRQTPSITAVAQKERTGKHARLDTGAELGGRLDNFFPDFIYFIDCSVRQI